MAIVIKAREVSYEIDKGKIVIKYAPYDDVANAFRTPIGYSRKVELELSEVTNDTLDELLSLGVDNEP